MNKTELENLFWLGLTVFHEARGETDLGQKAVVKVILNRSATRNQSIRDVVLAPKQFSCFNAGFNAPSCWIKDPARFRKVLENCRVAINEWKDGDRLSHADHYYAIKGMPGGQPPYWAAEMRFVVEIGGHRFFKS
jgi:N-acetylmuramoyl-L-alanine amidase